MTVDELIEEINASDKRRIELPKDVLCDHFKTDMQNVTKYEHDELLAYIEKQTGGKVKVGDDLSLVLVKKGEPPYRL